jgi:DNA-binding CsgD family transcriptional regulator/predicted GIY-YIG superfamily endonuclease
MNTAVVYLAYGAADRLLYVGVADDWTARRNQHRRDSEWWPLMRRVEFEQYPDRPTALVREATLIGQLDPPYNRTAWHGRDERIAALRSQGRTNVEIAHELGMSKQMLDRAIRRLLRQGRIQRQRPGGGNGGRRRWSAELLGVSEPTAWNIAHPKTRP